MTSKIINMADKIKDAEDHLLESLFRSEEIADNGFSKRVITRIRRRIWLRRLALPGAMLIGAAIAARPLFDLLTATSKLLTAVPESVLNMPSTLLPQFQVPAFGTMLAQTIVFAAILVGVGIIGARYLNE